MIRPFLSKMTKSELHAICTGGFATVAGSTMGGYIAYKVLSQADCFNCLRRIIGSLVFLCFAHCYMYIINAND